MLHTPKVTIPSLPGKNRPSCRGPETQGTTPTICVGALRGRLFSCRFFTQPLKPTDTCRNGRTVDVRLGLLMSRLRLGMGQYGSHREPGAITAGRETSHKEGVGLWALCPVDPMAGCLLAPGLAAVHHKLDLLHSPAHRHLGGRSNLVSCIPGLWGEGSFQKAFPVPCHPHLNLSPCATGQPGSAGDSGPGAGAQGLPSARQSVRGSERVPVKDHGLIGGRRKARGPGKQHAGGQASRGGAWKPSMASALAAPPIPPKPGLTSLTYSCEMGRHPQTAGNWAGAPQTGMNPE